MYYEDEPVRPRTRRKRRSLLGFLFRLILFVLILAVLAAGVLYLLPVGTFRTGASLDVSAEPSLPGGCVNVLLLGVDVDSVGTTRSDSMIIASIGKGKVKLTSLMRDTEVKVPGWKTAKLNAAYAHGGPELAMKTINETYGLNITRYAEVNYVSFADIVDAAGGINIGITAQEAHEINRNMKGQLQKEYQGGLMTKTQALRSLQQFTLEEKDYPQIHLNGQQALAYSRIRKLDSDYMRAGRQRKVLTAILERTKTIVFNPVACVSFVTEALRSVKTNMSMPEMISLGLKALASGGIEQMRLPVDGTYTGGKVDGDWRQHDVDYAANRRAFYEFVYE